MKGFIIGALKIVAYIAFFLFPLGYAFFGYQTGMMSGGDGAAIAGLIGGAIGGFILGTIFIGGLFVLIDIRDEVKALRKSMPAAVTASNF